MISAAIGDILTRAQATTTPAATADTGGDAPRKSQATALVDLAQAHGIELWHAPSGDPYCTLRLADHREHHALTSRHVRDYLARLHHVETGRTPGNAAIADALTTLGGMARFDGATHTPVVRVGGDGLATVYLDLVDDAWRAIEVTSSGWRVITDPPVRFIRSRGMLPLVVPATGGRVEDLREVIHVAHDDDYRLLVAWLLGALCPLGPYPLLALAGEQGAGKSTAARQVRRLIDPHVAELRAEPAAIDAIMIAASRSRVVALDNLSGLPVWLSDALCRLSTGGALTRRELYTDSDEIIIEAIRPAIITSITDIVVRGDLLDRAIAITLPVLPEARRRPEAELWQRYDAIAPGVLGALLDGVACALRTRADVRLTELPRLADWAVWTTAAEPALGWLSGSILAAYHGCRTSAIEASIDGDPLAAAVRAIARPWTGTASDLLTRLRPADGRVPRGWPESARALSSALRRIAPGLRRIGIEIITSREAHTGRRLVTLTDCEQGPDRPSPSSPPSQRPDSLVRSGDGRVTVGGLTGFASPVASPDSARVYAGCDDGDDGDDVSGDFLQGGSDAGRL